MWSRAAAIASNIARCVRGPSTSSRAWLPPMNRFSGGARCAVEPAFGGASAHPVRAANSAVKTAPTAKRPKTTLPLEPDIVLDRAHPLHLLRRGNGASRLVFRIDETGELDHPAIGVDVDRGGGPCPRVGRDGALHLRGERGVIGELAFAAAAIALLRGRARAEPSRGGRGQACGQQPAP